MGTRVVHVYSGILLRHKSNEIMSFDLRWIVLGSSRVVQWVKNPPAMPEIPEIRVQSLGQEDPLEDEMASHSSILAWRILWTEEPGGLESIRLQRV